MTDRDRPLRLRRLSQELLDKLHSSVTNYPFPDVDCEAHERMVLAFAEKVATEIRREQQERIEKLSRIVPSDLEPEDQWRRNGEYVSLSDVLAALAIPQTEQP